MSNTSMEELIVQERKAYFKEWRAKNKDKVRKNNQNYWKKRVEKRLKESEKNEQ